MKQRFIAHFLSAIFILTSSLAIPGIALAAGIGEKTPVPPPKKKQSREAYREELGRLIDLNHVSCSADDGCDAIGIGAMACGGPSEFIPASKATIAKIQTSVTELTKVIEEMDQARNKEKSMLGICLALAKPDVKCVSGKCTVKN